MPVNSMLTSRSFANSVSFSSRANQYESLDQIAAASKVAAATNMHPATTRQQRAMSSPYYSDGDDDFSAAAHSSRKHTFGVEYSRNMHDSFVNFDHDSDDGEDGATGYMSRAKARSTLRLYICGCLRFHPTMLFFLMLITSVLCQCTAALRHMDMHQHQLRGDSCAHVCIYVCADSVATTCTISLVPSRRS